MSDTAQCDAREELVRDGVASIRDTMQFTGMSRAALYREIQAGHLPIVKFGRRTMIPRRAVIRLLADRVRDGLGATS